MEKETKIAIGIVAGVGAIGLIYYLVKRNQPPAARIVAEPLPQLPVQPVLSAPMTTTDKLIQMASKQLGLPKEELTVRSLIPSDFGLTTWNFNLSSGNNNIISASVADNRFIALTGLSYPSVASGNAVTELTVNAGARKVEIWPIQHIPDLENPVWEDTSPTIVQQNESVSITAYATKSATAEPIILQGVVVERRGMTVA